MRISTECIYSWVLVVPSLVCVRTWACQNAGQGQSLPAHRKGQNGNNRTAKLVKQRNKLSSLMPTLREVQASCAQAPSVPPAAPVPTAEHSDMHVHSSLHIRCTQVI
jgi:hypothetical protein